MQTVYWKIWTKKNKYIPLFQLIFSSREDFKTI